MSSPTLARPVPYKAIHIKQNETFGLRLRLISRDENGDADIVDTDGWEAVLQVRPEPAANSPVILEASTMNGRIITGIQGDPGKEVNIDIKIPHEDTAGLAYFGEAGYDLLVIYPEGDQKYFLGGPATLEPAYSWEES